MIFCTRYVTVKVPAWVYDNAKLLVRDLTLKGTDALPRRLRARLEPDKPVNMSVVMGLGVFELQRHLRASQSTERKEKR
jgi:hypothetical protein